MLHLWQQLLHFFSFFLDLINEYRNVMVFMWLISLIILGVIYFYAKTNIQF